MASIGKYLVVIGGILLPGCVKYTHVSGDAHHPNRYREGGVYILKQLVEGALSMSDSPAVAMSSKGVVLFRDEHDFRMEELYHDEQFVTVPSGTKILVRSFRIKRTFCFPTWDLIDATFVSGPFTGAKADLMWISKYEPAEDLPEHSIRVRDPEYLEEDSPNHAPEPTALAVTPAADAPVAPAHGRGSS
jgi:hypothetical protein